MKNIAVLRGGPSPEYETSLLSGQAVLDALDPAKYIGMDIFIDKNALWHYKGLPALPIEVLQTADLVFNCLHGPYGEDGQVQNILEQANVPFTGPGAFHAALSFHKALALSELKKAKIKNLRFQGQVFLNTLDIESEDLDELGNRIYQKISPPFIIKPVKSGSSFGVAFAETKPELLNLIVKTAMEFDEIVVEEFIFGKEVTVSVVEGLRGEDIYVAPPIEIVKKEKRIFDTDTKYKEALEERVRFPASVSHTVKSSIENLSKEIFKVLGARHFARIDYIIAREKDIYFLELNSIPGLTAQSLLPQNLQLLGVSFPEFVEHIVEIASGI